MYLECKDHDPPIRSADEVGQHTYDLKNIQGYFAKRKALVQINEMDDVTFESDTRWLNTAMYFFAQHPNCRIGIRDEYGQEYPTEVEHEKTSDK